MNCDEIQKLFGEYWDLPDDDERRIQVQEHIKRCGACAEEFAVWEESARLIRSVGAGDAQPLPAKPISNRVMSRIYEAESWRIPIPDRMYMISRKMRLNFTAAIAFCLALFVGSFLYTLLYGGNDAGGANKDSSVYGLHPVATAASAADSMDVRSMPSAVASLSDPFLLKMGPIHTFPEYLLAISILGMVCTLLIMNWLSRTKV